MRDRGKIGRNDSCPCLSGKKFKHCCQGKTDWTSIIREGGDIRNYLSIKGRNQLFMEALIKALQLDKLEVQNLAKYKRAFTANAVRKIHEAVEIIWPIETDIKSALTHDPDDISGLYVGDYSPEYLIRAIVRHSIYSDKILVVDPFVYPRSVREEFNPIINPEQYRSQTLKNANFWIALYPWIDSGIVEIIRTPADFDPELNWSSMKRAKEKFKSNEKLQRAAEISVEETNQRHKKKMAYEMLFLGAPNDYLERIFSEIGLDDEVFSFDDMKKYVEHQRASNPNFLAPLGADGLDSQQLHMMSTGANYEVARITAGFSNSYLVTDVFSKWAEIEFERESANVETKVWSPMAKAIQNAPFKYLNTVDLKDAKRIRDEGRLQSMRLFLHRVWKAALKGEEFSEENARHLSEELLSEVHAAEHEWREVDRDLIRWVGAEVTAGALAAGPLIASGHGSFVAAAVAVAGITNLMSSTSKRKSFPDQFPAAFFMNLESDK